MLRFSSPAALRQAHSASLLFLLPKKLRFSGALLKASGTLLLSHAVSSIVPSAARVLTIVFGMGTGVSPGRIGTRCLCQSPDS